MGGQVASQAPTRLPQNRFLGIVYVAVACEPHSEHSGFMGVETEHMHNFDESWMSLCHVVQENEKSGRKTANINTKNLRSFITVKAYCSVIHRKQQKSFSFLSSIWSWM